MTDVSPSDDELVSSYLDNEATPDEVARVEGDPALMARVEEMRAAIAFVNTPPPLPEADLARIRGIAVAAFGTGVATPGSTAPVVDMAAARAKRLQRRNRVLAVAAGVLLFGGLIGGLASINGGSNDADTADSGNSDDSSSDDSADDAADDESFATMGDANDADMESAEMAAEADMSADTGTADDDSVDTEGDADDGADDTADDGSGDDVGEEAAPSARMQMSLSFDPLPDDLGVFASVEDLAAAVETMVIEMIIDEESDFAPEEFLPFSTCDETLAVALAGDHGLEVDTAEAVVDATLYTIVVGRQFDTGQLVGRLAPSDVCSPATELFVAP